MPSVHICFELSPQSVVLCRIFVSYPKTNDVIDKAFVEEDILFPTWYYFVLVESVKDGGVWRSWRCAHGSSRKLAPISITEAEDIVPKHQTHAFNECFFAEGTYAPLCEYDSKYFPELVAF